MFYDKQIKYLDVYEKGEKTQNAGFIRMEAREDRVNLQIRVEKLRHTDSCKVQVVLAGEEKDGVLEEMQLENGRGMLECKGLYLQDMAEGISYGDLCEIHIKLPGERLLKCIIREKKSLKEVEPETVSESMLEAKHVSGQIPMSVVQQGTVYEQILPSALQAGTGYVPMSPMIPPQENVLEQVPTVLQQGNALGQMPSVISQQGMTNRQMSQPVPQAQENFEQVPVPSSEMPQEQKQILVLQEKGMGESGMPYMSQPMRGYEQMIPSEPQRKDVPGTVALHGREPGPILRPIPQPPQSVQMGRPREDNKWKQLSAIYPHIRPFEDGRDYLQIKPEDFVILTQKYYPLVTNSFLLHGYYNYGYLILTRERRPDGEHFFIGVPGNFYDKEKQVAVLFGFESFEGKAEPAKNGDFGYYMIAVEI